MNEFTIGQVSKNNLLFELEAHLPLTSAFELFQNQKLHSIPIYGKPGHFLSSGNESLSVHNGKQYISILTLLDCIVYLLQDQNHSENDTVLQACGASAQSQSLWIYEPEKKLVDCLEPMAKGIHTFLVGSKSSQDPLFIVTQSDIIDFIYKNSVQDPRLIKFLETPLDQIVDKKPVISTGPNESLAEVLKMMAQKSINSVAICQNNILIDYFSISDLRVYLWASTIFKAKIDDLKSISVESYLFTLRQSHSPPVGLFCLPTSTLGEAVEFAISAHSHRVWVVDSIVKHEKHPLFVVSLTDMIASLWKLSG